MARVRLEDLPCHYWVHSRENAQKEFIIEYNN